MNGVYSDLSLGEAVTGWQIQCQAYTDAPWNGGAPRVLPCMTNGSGQVTEGGFAIGSNPTSPGVAYTSAPILTVDAPPAGGRQALVTPVMVSGALAGIIVNDPGYGYAQGTVNVTVSGGVGATTPCDNFTLNVSAAAPSTAANAQQFSFKLSNFNGSFLRADSDASQSKKQIIIMDGMIPAGQAGASNVTATLAMYTTGRLKATEAPIRIPTSRDETRKSWMMAQALAELCKYSPELYATDIGLGLSMSIFRSMDGSMAALHAASDGFGGQLMKIGGRMHKAAKGVYNTTQQAIDSLDPSTKSAIASLASGPEAKKVYRKLKNMTGLSHIPDETIMRGAKLGDQALKHLFSGTDSHPLGAGLFGDIGNVADHFLSGSDAHPMGAGFWNTVGKVAETTAVVAPLLLAGSDGHPRASSNRYFAASVGEFPVLDKDGELAGKLNMKISKERQVGVKYNTHTSPQGTIHFDDRLKSLERAGGSNPIKVGMHYLEKNVSIPELYVSVIPLGGSDIYGQSWEATFCNQLAGHNDLITGKIDGLRYDGDDLIAKIGSIVGADQKARLGEHLIVPASNADEAPDNRGIKAIVV